MVLKPELPGLVMSLLLMELLSSLTPPQFTVLETFLQAWGTQPVSQEAHSGSLQQVQGLAGVWGGAGALSPDRWWWLHTAVYL